MTAGHLPVLVHWSEATLAHRVEMGRKGAGLTSPQRMEAARRAVDRLSGRGVQLETSSPHERTVDRFICDTHDPALWKQIGAGDLAARTAGGAVRLRPGDPDTELSAGSQKALRASVAGLLSCVDAVLDARASSAFALGLGGHHATRSRAMGFCFVNGIAVAAQYALRRRGLARVLVVDLDVHHGNGTQDIFHDRDDVLFVSLHRYPSTRFYPLSGWAHEEGEGRGRGHTLNVPLRPPAGDPEYLAALAQIRPRLVAHQPQLILVSMGYDAHVDDPLGGKRGTGMCLSTAGFGHITDWLLDLARDTSGGHIAFNLEGGYELDALGDGIAISLARMVERQQGARRSPRARSGG